MKNAALAGLRESILEIKGAKMVKMRGNKRFNGLNGNYFNGGRLAI